MKVAAGALAAVCGLLFHATASPAPAPAQQQQQQQQQQQATRPVPPGRDAILTPARGPAPQINFPRVFGVRPGSPVLITIPTSGRRPIRFSTAEPLPPGLRLDDAAGRLTGTLEAAGEHVLVVRAVSEHGSAEARIRIVAGDKIALTPPMGWNSWYCYWDAVTDTQMRRAADAMVQTGLIEHGYAYVNIDDGWSIKPGSKDAALSGAERDEAGRINANGKFPDMRAMTDYIHALGLKAGIYTSPGPLTCAGYVGSYQHEEQDAARFADWGFDFLKHDWCSYRKIAPDPPGVEDLKKPYKVMGDALRRQKRDIVYNLCQYGMGDVYRWGEEVGAHCWRTAGDLGSHKDLYAGVIKDGFLLDGKQQFVRPGAYNDPDYLQVGPLFRGPRAARKLLPSPMTAYEQYAHMSLWCLLAAPLFIGGDVANLDPFTVSLLTNDEVIAVNQDPLCRQAHRVAGDGATRHVWAKEMEDGSRAVGLFNTGTTPAEVSVNWPQVGVAGRGRVRDLWRQKDIGVIADSFKATVPAHGVVLVRVVPERS